MDKGGGKSTGSGRSSAPELATRDERKLRTRSSLMDAALTLMNQGRSFTSLGLREITREAGVVPTSFYRHFRDMDELGLALVDDGGATLRQLLRDARKDVAPVSDIIRASVLSITDDQRLQMLLIGFAFGAFLEGAAGFGAPVAITSALLVGLGFNPLYAAGLCLIANTAPVAFGAMGIPIIVAGQVTGIDAMHIGAMAGRQLPLLSLFVPFWLVFMMDGFRGIKEVWPAALVSGGSFAVTQYLTSNFIGPELPDITSALVCLVSLTVFLKVWQPASAKAGATGVASVGGGAAALSGFGGFPAPAAARSSRKASPYTPGQTILAWTPFLILTGIVTIWSLPGFKAMFGPKGALAGTILKFKVPYLDQLVMKTAPIVSSPKAYEALLKIDLLSAVGTAILLTYGLKEAFPERRPTARIARASRRVTRRPLSPPPPRCKTATATR